jgi:hypothetical protein
MPWSNRRATWLLLLVLGCTGVEEEEQAGRDNGTADASPSWSDSDWDVLQTKSRWALDQGLDTIPLGDAMARLGRAFVGTPYVPGTLEVDGPERLVINFQGLDCVTFVENVLSLARFVRGGGVAALLENRVVAEQRYEALLTEIRYRQGRVEGYPSRLHYFTDWIGRNEERGLVRDVTREIGADLDTEPVDFMTTHTEAYRQLSEPEHVSRIREAEERLSEKGRWYLPQDRLGAAVSTIRDGDIIAATSTVPGLDVAHTGIALWVDGRLHLLHAPLVGEAVQVSELPLAERLLGIGGQDGVIVARPTETR